jgi:transposase
MPRPLTVRKPCRAEIDDLNILLEQELTAGQRRRAEVLVLHAAGVEGQDIAHTLDIHVNTVYADLKAFAREGLACVHHCLQGGAPIRIREAQRTEILRLAQITPGEVGLPYGRWSLAKLCQYLIQQRIVPTISREYLRQVLKKGGCGFVISSANSAVMTRDGALSWRVSE